MGAGQTALAAFFRRQGNGRLAEYVESLDADDARVVAIDSYAALVGLDALEGDGLGGYPAPQIAPQPIAPEARSSGFPADAAVLEEYLLGGLAAEAERKGQVTGGEQAAEEIRLIRRDLAGQIGG